MKHPTPSPSHLHILHIGRLAPDEEKTLHSAFEQCGFSCTLRTAEAPAGDPTAPAPDLILIPCRREMDLAQISKLCRRLSAAIMLLVEEGNEDGAVEAFRDGAEGMLVTDPAGGYLKLLPWMAAHAVQRHRELNECRVIRERLQVVGTHLSDVIQGSPVATFAIDANHVVTEWNRACEVLTGIPAREMVGTLGHWRTFYPERRPALSDLVVDGASEEAILAHYGDKAHPSPLVPGAYEAEDFFPEHGKWFFFTAAPLRDSRGRTVGAVETLEDVTERKTHEAVLQESERRYRELSITDSLTGLFNSRHFYNQLAAEMNRANRYGSPLSLMLLDVDNFKHYNDTYGHLAGDKVLSVLAGVIRMFLRSTDTGFRFGGEEFTIILPETDLPEALVVAERLRRVFAELAFYPSSGQRTQVTISIGVGRFQPGEDAAEFIRRTDSATYLAKQLGKNRVEPGHVAPPQMADPFLPVSQ